MASVSYERAAGTSEETRPGTIFKISAPNATVLDNQYNANIKEFTKFSKAFLATSSEFEHEAEAIDIDFSTMCEYCGN